MACMAAIPLQREPEIEYPTGDGKPMAETGLHVEVMIYLYQALKERFAGVSDVLVSANNFFYYKEGDPKSVVSPDVYMVKGVPSAPPRDNYLLWKEGKVPSLIVEVTSRSTRGKDLKKKDLYAKLGVPEYFMFDPEGDYLKPPLQGFRLLKGEYLSIPPAADGSVTSRTTGVIFHPEKEWVRLVDAATGEPLLTSEEWREKTRAVEERAKQEAEARRQAELRVRELEEELERLRRKSGS
jgi:Uma2 family endonuclease